MRTTSMRLWVLANHGVRPASGWLSTLAALDDELHVAAALAAVCTGERLDVAAATALDRPADLGVLNAAASVLHAAAAIAVRSPFEVRVDDEAVQLLCTSEHLLPRCVAALFDLLDGAQRSAVIAEIGELAAATDPGSASPRWSPYAHMLCGSALTDDEVRCLGNALGRCYDVLVHSRIGDVELFAARVAGAGLGPWLRGEFANPFDPSWVPAVLAEMRNAPTLSMLRALDAPRDVGDEAALEGVPTGALAAVLRACRDKAFVSQLVDLDSGAARAALLAAFAGDSADDLAAVYAR
jgi:hypothetical protein